MAARMCRLSVSVRVDADCVLLVEVVARPGRRLLIALRAESCVDRLALSDLSPYTAEEVARCLRVSPRWLADHCRAERVAHVHAARGRRFTQDQVEALIASRTVLSVSDKKLDATRQRVLRLLARR